MECFQQFKQMDILGPISKSFVHTYLINIPIAYANKNDESTIPRSVAEFSLSVKEQCNW